jgi:hypothetical protein
MPARKPAILFLRCAAAFAVLAGALPARAQETQLGRAEFPTSGSGAAQAHFLRGVAALHSFWFEEALDEFRAATAADPNFLMGCWGQAMSYNHPLWAEQDTAAARAVLERIAGRRAPTARENAYLDAVRALYGAGDKLARDRAYCAEMEKAHRSYPEDSEAALFYALSLLGTVRPGDTSFRRQMQAGAIALAVFAKNPNHPGAAHYIIHAFDDPDHAILALDAARRYAEIAPAAHHARHMPAHIFLQLGMWPEAAASNESAWAASVAWVERKHLSPAQRDLHSLHWLFYVYLQQGRYAKAAEVFALRQRVQAEVGEAEGHGAMHTAMGGRYYDDMRAEFVIETGQWARAEQFFPASAADAGTSRGQVLSVFVRGLAAAQANSAEAEQSAAKLAAARAELERAGETYRAKQIEIMELEVKGLFAARQGSAAAATEAMQRAVKLEEELAPPSGPPDLIKPAHELFGEILLPAGQPQQAARQFARALEREPNRARSLLGAARAAAQSGDAAGAAAAYGKLLEIWRQADPQLAELKEAQQYLNGTRASAQPR